MLIVTVVFHQIMKITLRFTTGLCFVVSTSQGYIYLICKVVCRLAASQAACGPKLAAAWIGFLVPRRLVI